MKCLVCGYDAADGEAACRRCGFPFIVQIGDNTDTDDRLRQMADQYRRQMSGQYEIGIAVYTNTVRNRRIEVEKTEYVRLGNGDALPEGFISWFPEGFVRPLSNELEFTYYVRKGNGPRYMQSISLKLPPSSGDIHIGILGEGEAMFSFCAGSASDYVKSEKMNLFAQQYAEYREQ